MLQRTTILLMLLLFACSKAGSSEAFSPYHVKAAFLYNFLKFVEWPRQTLPDDSPYIVGVLGKDPFGAVLNGTMHGKTVNGRRIVVMRVTEENMKMAHILFISSSEQKRYRQILEALRSAPVLTVGETDQFAESGGVVEFYIEGNKVRFQINLEAAKKSDLHIDSALLNLARLVRTR